MKKCKCEKRNSKIWGFVVIHDKKCEQKRKEK
jgi:hypothetical protein